MDKTGKPEPVSLVKKPEPDATGTEAANWEGWSPRECGEHRTVGPHRAWCFDCGEWCYPEAELACARCWPMFPSLTQRRAT